MSLETAADAVLSRRQYESVLEAAETYREALVVRLCGEVGLRPVELASLTIDDIEQVRMDPPRYLVRVPAVGNREGRTAYLPTNVERELRRYARSNDLSVDDRIFPVTPRRLQMLVSDVGDRASEFFGDPALADVSTGDLKRYFAHRSLVAADVNPRVVKSVGGWHSFEALESYLPEPTDTEVVDAFEATERADGPGEEPSGPVVGDDGVVRLLLAASDQYALVRLDEEGYVERWNRSGASLFGYRAGEIVGTHVSAFYPEEAVEDGVPERTLATALEDSGHETDGWRVHKDGSRFRATEVITPLRDDRGRHCGYAIFVRDVSGHQAELEAVRSRCADLERRCELADRQRALTHTLLEATDHEEVEKHASETLAGGEAYDVAWIDRTTLADRRSEWRITSGPAPAEIDRLEPDELDDIVDEFEVTAADDGDSEKTLARVPLTYGDTTYGMLSVATSRSMAFDDDERDWLETVGRQIGYAITAVRRRNLLLSDRVCELEIACRDERSFFIHASSRLGCRFELDSLVPVSESTQLYYVDLQGASPADVVGLADEDSGITDCRLIETYEDGWRLEFVVEGSSPTLTLTEYGVTVVEAEFVDGTATITGECASDADLRTILGGLCAVFPDSELIGKRDVERTVRTAREFRDGLEDRLTDRQEAALRAAYFGGYYDWPRESTAEEVADAMGISSPTLHNHLRKGQHELLRTLFDQSNQESTPDPSG